MAVSAATNGAVLTVSPKYESYANLAAIFEGFGWAFLTANSLASSFSILRERPVSIVICDDDLLPGLWREMLTYLALLDDPPLLIVTARLADERFWAEALNLGAYDVLAVPLDMTEAVRIVDSAQQHWHNRRKLRTGGKATGLQPAAALRAGGSE
jgi:DNA-binding NtrC family response regulator